MVQEIKLSWDEYSARQVYQILSECYADSPTDSADLFSLKHKSASRKFGKLSLDPGTTVAVITSGAILANVLINKFIALVSAHKHAEISVLTIHFKQGDSMLISVKSTDATVIEKLSRRTSDDITSIDVSTMDELYSDLTDNHFDDEKHASEYVEPSSDTIFFSYKRSDWNTCVKHVYERLTANGIKVWIDRFGIQAGTDWLDEITKALQTCDRMVLFASSSALSSRYVKLEYRYFFHNNKLLYPLRCDSTNFPPELQGLQYSEINQIEDLINLLTREPYN